LLTENPPQLEYVENAKEYSVKLITPTPTPPLPAARSKSIGVIDLKSPQRTNRHRKSEWGLARICGRHALNKRKCTGEPGNAYVYDRNAGRGNWVYLLDTGVKLSHNVSLSHLKLPSDAFGVRVLNMVISLVPNELTLMGFPSF
jgi:hypothetical protein